MYRQSSKVYVRRSGVMTGLRRAAALAVIGASLLAATPGKALAAENPAWVARHGLSSADYQAEFNRWVGAGYRLVSVSGYDDAGAERYAAIWRKVSGPSWQARHGLTSQQYQATFNQLVAQGYRPVLVNGYEVGGTARFAAIFELGGSAAWVARHDLTSAQYQAEFDTRVAQGYRLLHVSGYTSGGAERYAAVWERSPGPGGAGVPRPDVVAVPVAVQPDDEPGLPPDDGQRVPRRRGPTSTPASSRRPPVPVDRAPRPRRHALSARRSPTCGCRATARCR